MAHAFVTLSVVRRLCPSAAQDLCLISNGDHGVFLKESAAVPRTLALELLDELIVNNGPLLASKAFEGTVNLKVSRSGTSSQPATFSVVSLDSGRRD